MNFNIDNKREWPSEKEPEEQEGATYEDKLAEAKEIFASSHTGALDSDRFLLFMQEKFGRELKMNAPDGGTNKILEDLAAKGIIRKTDIDTYTYVGEKTE